MGCSPLLYEGKLFVSVWQHNPQRSIHDIVRTWAAAMYGQAAAENVAQILLLSPARH